MAAHDHILEAWVKQIRAANRKRRFDPFKKDDLVYVSTKNLSFEKGLACKLIPKYIGPYQVLEDFQNHSFRIDLPSEFLQQGVHPVFHSSLLRIHVPNNDHRFPGRLHDQLHETAIAESQWRIDKVISHSGAKHNEVFQVLWSTGDSTWMPYAEIGDLPCVIEYLELLGLEDISQLKMGRGAVPKQEQIELGLASVSLDIAQGNNFYLGFTYNEMGSASDLYIQKPPSPMSFVNGKYNFSILTQISAGEFITGDKFQSDPISYSAQQVWLYIAYDRDLREQGNTVDWIPDGYPRFAKAFNLENFVDKFARIDFQGKPDADKNYPILDLDSPGPTFARFGVEPYECFEKGVHHHPGYVEITEKEYRELRETAYLQARTATRGRQKDEQKRYEKRMEAEAICRREETQPFMGYSRRGRDSRGDSPMRND